MRMQLHKNPYEVNQNEWKNSRDTLEIKNVDSLQFWGNTKRWNCITKELTIGAEVRLT